MKTMKMNLMLAFLLIGSIAFAQPPGGGQRGGQQGPPPIPSEKQIEKMVDELAEEISLLDGQKTMILDAYIDHFEEVEELTSGSSRPDRSKMEALEASFQKKVEAMLTDDQKEAYKAYMKEQSANKKRR